MEMRNSHGFEIGQTAWIEHLAPTPVVLSRVGTLAICCSLVSFATESAQANTKQTGSLSVQQQSVRASAKNLYGGSFYKTNSSSSVIRPLTSISNPLKAYDSAIKPQSSIMQNANQYGGSFYSGMANSPMHLQTTHNGIGPGISGLGGPGFSGSSGLGTPSSVRPNGIGAPAARSIPMITPFGNGANAPMGMYGGNSFGSSAGGSVR